MLKRLCFILTFVVCGVFAFGQSVNEVRINEFLVKNVSNYEDDYGNREAWIELYNASHSTVNVAGCYLTTKLGDEKFTYRIPTNDKRTLIPPLGYVVFFCEGTQYKGTFHTNFTLDQTGYLAFLNASSGIVDEVKYDLAAQQEDVSMGRITEDGETRLDFLIATTPLSTNDIGEEVPQFEQFRRRDPTGMIMTITAMCVVFSALIVLFLFFKVLGIFMVRIAGRKEVASKKASSTDEADEPAAKPAASGTSYSGEEIAAIALAVQMYQSDLHDKESSVLTINRVARAYSPWSSKIYGLRQIPNRK